MLLGKLAAVKLLARAARWKADEAKLARLRTLGYRPAGSRGKMD
jgi:hypothetical protein